MPSHRYDSMVDFPRPKAYKPMSLLNRAAQFSPFAALTGYEEQIRETARLTDEEVTLSESEMEVLDQKLQYINAHLHEAPHVSIRYYIADNELFKESKKTGGEYFSHSGTINKLDVYNKKIIFSDSFEININKIINIEILTLQDNI